MDIDRLSLDEVRRMSQLIDLMGVPASLDELATVIRVLRATTYKYEQAIEELQRGIRD